MRRSMETMVRAGLHISSRSGKGGEEFSSMHCCSQVIMLNSKETSLPSLNYKVKYDNVAAVGTPYYHHRERLVSCKIPNLNASNYVSVTPRTVFQ